MKIESLKIIAFGKFENKTINFSDGLNVIYGDNESGKSTIINFIYVMLYGFGDSRGKALSIRDKYVPWKKEFCEGKITLIDDDERRITIYRKSGNAKKYDVVRIYDADSGEDLPFSPEQLVGVNSDTFLKTLCIRQLSTAFDGSNDEISQKLSNITSGGDESVNYEKALKILDSLRREIQPRRGSGGELNEITQKIFELENKQKERKNICTELDSLVLLTEKESRITKALEEEYERLCEEDFSSPIAHISGRIDEITFRHKTKRSLHFYIGAVLSALCAVIMFFIKAQFSVLFILTLIIFLIPLFKKNNLSSKIEKLDSERKKLVESKTIHDKKLSEVKSKLDTQKQKFSSLCLRKEQLTASMPTESVELSALYLKKSYIEKRLRIVTLATEALIDAHDEMQKNFTPAINRRASEYFSEITGGRYNKIYCDEAFGIRVDADLPRESSFFSGGTIDQLYLSLRLSLTDMLFKNKSCVMILDQPFLQYDDIRKSRTVALLQSLPKNRQILLFTGDKNIKSANKATEILT